MGLEKSPLASDNSIIYWLFAGGSGGAHLKDKLKLLYVAETQASLKFKEIDSILPDWEYKRFVDKNINKTKILWKKRVFIMQNLY